MPITPQGESRGQACLSMTEPLAELSKGQLGSIEVATAPSNLRIVRQQSCQQFYIVALRNEAVLRNVDNSDYANKLASLV